MTHICSDRCRHLITQSHLVYVTDHTTEVQSDVYCIVAYVRSSKYIPGILSDIMIYRGLHAVSHLICKEYYQAYVLPGISHGYELLGYREVEGALATPVQSLGMVHTHVSYTPTRVIQIKIRYRRYAAEPRHAVGVCPSFSRLGLFLRPLLFNTHVRLGHPSFTSSVERSPCCCPLREVGTSVEADCLTQHGRSRDTHADIFICNLSLIHI